MSLEAEIADRVVRRVRRATGAWSRGFPSDETALLNHVSGSFRTRPGCSRHRPPAFRASSHWSPLHRRGTRARDLLGSDLAVSIFIDKPQRLKTAFIQVKVSDDSSCALRRDQFEHAMILPMVAERAFVFHLNKQSQEIRVSRILDYAGALRRGNTVVNTENWCSLRAWLRQWLRCTIGPRSGLDDVYGPEVLLASYAMQPVPFLGFDHGEVPEDVRRPLFDVPPEFTPATAWLTAEVALGA